MGLNKEKLQMEITELVYWNTHSYGKIKRVTPSFVGFCLDRVIPMTFVLIQLSFIFVFEKKLKVKEFFRITIHNKNNYISY
jgi:hypothetical protein